MVCYKNGVTMFIPHCS